MPALSRANVEWLIRTDPAFKPVAPEEPLGQWNVTEGAGWTDVANDPDGDPLNFSETKIFNAVSCGGRFLNNAAPLPGLKITDLGSMAMAYYLELMHPWWDITLGTTNKTSTPTAGVAAKASLPDILTLVDLDTQPTGEEVLVFDITVGVTGSTAGVVIDVLVDTVSVEQLNVPDITGTASQFFIQTKGGYGPTVTFSVTGVSTVTSVSVAGVQYWTTEWKPSDVAQHGVIEQIGRVEVDPGDSQFATGVLVPDMALNYDRTDQAGMLMYEPTIGGNEALPAASNACAGDARGAATAIAAWYAAITINAAQDFTVQNFSLAPNTLDEFYLTSTGDQAPRGKLSGLMEVTAPITIIPEDKSRFTSFINTTPENWSIVFSTPQFVNGSQPFVLQIDCSQAYIEEYTAGNSNMAQSADLALRMISNETDGGPFKITQIDRRGF